MEAFRHLNVLLDERTYAALRETSFRQKKTVSEIVRQGIRNILDSYECKEAYETNQIPEKTTI